VRDEAVQEGQAPNETNDYPLSKISKLAIDMGVSDLSTHHREYAHGPTVIPDASRS
jgi:hypothetical protein